MLLFFIFLRCCYPVPVLAKTIDLAGRFLGKYGHHLIAFMMKMPYTVVKV